MRNPDLWDRLQAYSFDGAGSAPYSVKLARAEGWSHAFSKRVIEEYRRYAYLTQVSPRQLTPSNGIDAAWHMHLVYTREYWQNFCPNVLGNELHHTPCGGEEEMPRYRDQFAATKALYEAEFGEEPPADIWGRDATPKKRPLRAFARSERGAAGPLRGLLLGAALTALGWYIFEEEIGDILGILVSGAGLWLLINVPIRAWIISRDVKRRRAEGDTTVTTASVFFLWSYESDDPSFDAGGGGGGDGDGGGCGGCGGCG